MLGQKCGRLYRPVSRKDHSTLGSIAAANLRYVYSVATSFLERPRLNSKFVEDVVSSFRAFVAVAVVAIVVLPAFHFPARIPIRCS